MIPALNEQDGIQQTLLALPKQSLHEMGYEVQVLVVDNGSTDSTAEIARNAGADVVSEPRRGYGYALKRGFATASGSIIATADADGTYPLEIIPLLLRTFEDEGLDFLTTNRLAGLSEEAMSRQNQLGNSILTAVTRLIFGMDVRDVESGMWVFRKNLLPELKLSSNSWPLSHEIKIEAYFYAKCRSKEVPIPYKHRIGQTNLMNAWRVGFTDLLHIVKKRMVR